MAARCCQDALRASRTREDVYHVLRLMVRLSDDIGEFYVIVPRCTYCSVGLIFWFCLALSIVCFQLIDRQILKLKH